MSATSILSDELSISNRHIAPADCVVLIAGVLATGVSFFAFLFGTLRNFGETESIAALALSFAIAAVICLLSATFGDVVNSKKGRYGYLGIAALAFVASAALGCANIVWHALFASIGFIMLLLVWGKLLSILSYRAFVAIIAAVLFVLAVGWRYLPLLLSLTSYMVSGLVCALLAIVGAFVVAARTGADAWTFCSVAESKTIETATRVDYSPAQCDGLLFGLLTGYLVHCVQSLTGGFMYIELGFGIGTLVCLLQLAPNFRFSQFLRTYAPCVKLIPLLFIPLALKSSDVAFLGALATLIVVVYSAMLLSSLVERVRFLSLLPYYVYGNHGTRYFGFAALGVLISALAFDLFNAGRIEGDLLFLVTTLFAEVLLVPSLRWGTTFDRATEALESAESVESVEQAEDTADDEVETEEAMPDSQKVPFREKIAYVGTKFGLTKRQQEVLTYLAKGRTAAYIAEELVVSNATAKTHIYNIYMKLDVHTQQELIELIEATEIEE